MNLLSELAQLNQLYGEFMALARQTLEHLEEKRWPELERTWQQRRRLFSQICELRRRLQPALEDWSSAACEMGAAQARQAEQDIARIEDRARHVLQMDRQAQSRLEELCKSNRRQRGRLRDGKRLLSGYAQTFRGKAGPHKISRSG